MATVLVTGGSGFVGGWCIVELLRRGHDVRTTLRSQAKEAGVRASIASATGASDQLTVFIADLTHDAGWDDAVAGCDYVLHVASPLGMDAPGDPDALITPAREGTLRVLRAAQRAGVKRVVMTSSTAAATPPAGVDRDADESVWTDLSDKTLNAYRRSKVVAERAAWDFMAGQSGPTTLTTILPVAIFGPILTTDNLGSVQFIQRLLQGRPPGLLDIGFNIVDVRDLAELHIRAMTAPEAAGQRFIAASNFLWLREIATVLRAKLGSRASKIPRRVMPDFLVRILAVFIRPLATIIPLLGREQKFSAAKAQRVLGFSPRTAESTVLDCAESLLAMQPAAAR